MTFLFLTCDRSPNYFAETVASFHKHVGAPFTVSQGSPTDGNLDGLDLQAVVRPQIPHDADVRVKSTLNYINCLAGSGDAMIFEDDVKFSSLSRDTIDALAGCKQIVALYHCYPLTTGNSLTVPYAISGFYGTQGMYYPEAVREPLADYLMANLGRDPYDLLIKAWCMENSHDMLALRHCIVQHIGVVTTGLGHHHTTGNFVP
jgi:hypothetical protein